MKMLDKESIQGFFINHVEKMCFAVVVLCFLLILWKAFSLPKLEIKPEQLQSSVESAKTNLESTKADKNLLSDFNFVEEAEISTSPIKTTPLRLATAFDRPLFQPRDKRVQPPVLAVRSLQGNSGNGAFGTTSPNYMENLAMGGMDNMRSGRTVKEKNGVRWVVITGLIPFTDQQKAFEDTFKNAQVKTPNDLPVYRGYLIERSEVNPARPNEFKWEKLDIREAIKANRRLAGGSEVVDPKYLLQTGSSFNMAMPPLNIANHRWGLDCAHLPEVPMIKTRLVVGSDFDDEELEPGEEEGMETMDGQLQEDLDPLADTTTPDGMYPGRDPSMMEELPDFRLLRFFDTTVEAGKRYRYRFKLVLNNPNYGLAPRFVQKEEMTKTRLLESDWSEPSEIIEAPRDSRVLCIGNREKQDSSGPAGQIMVVQFEENSGAEIYKPFSEITAGKWLNFMNVMLADPDKKEDEFMAPDEFDLDSGLSKKEKRERQAEAKRLQAERTAKKPLGPKANFLSNCLMLDMAGGDRAPGVTIPLPVRNLILDADGKLVIHSEITDKPEVYLRTKEPEKKQEIVEPMYDDPADKKNKRKRRPTGADIM